MAGCTSFKTYQIANALRMSERHGFTRLVVVGAKRNLLGQDVFSRYPTASPPQARDSAQQSWKRWM